MVYEAVFFKKSSKTHHTRDAFDFLLFLANIGGVQLVLDILSSKILEKSQKNKTLYDVLRIFFIVKSKNPVPHLSRPHEEEHHYKLKLTSEFVMKMGVLNTICCYPCKRANKHMNMVDQIMERGETKLNKYINAQFVFETLKKHHLALKELKPDQVS
jgi:hypothetical protein